ncbi:MAG: 30S ribosomal protein S2 [Candidatus Uhrbacteria bacterium]|nr:30S ribosomal protein S2 [Patescibacteria group bacterium]MBU1906691.1 30S ribosomal protein S2 [Patescibacteria group bacterium]
MPKIPSLEEMLSAGVHFGHRTSHWHPKMEPYIFTARGGVHIINLEETQKQLEDALSYIKDIAARGGVILFVGTKRQAQKLVGEAAERVGMPYVNGRWLGGTLTNFGEIRRLVKRYLKLKDQQDKDELTKYTKKERLMISREIEDMASRIYGIRNLEAKPDAIFILDLRHEKTALQEAEHEHIPVVALCDTNVNPDKIKKVIPANDDAVKSIEMMLDLVAQAIEEGKKEGSQLVNAAAKKEVKKPVKDENGDELAVTESSRAVVEDLDLKVHDQLAKEKIEEEKVKSK